MSIAFPVEFATMTLDPQTNLPLAKIFRSTELDELLRKYELGGTAEAEVAIGQGTGGGNGGDASISVST
jgi:20S proteasome subunit alpha 3